MCAIFLCFWHYNRQDRAALAFAAAYLMCAVGFFLNHFVLPKETLANAVIHNSFYAAGLFFLSEGFHSAFRRTPPRALLTVLGVGSVIAAGIIQVSFAGLSVRIVTINLIHGSMLIVAAWTLRGVWRDSWTGTALAAALSLCIINFMVVSPITVYGSLITGESFFASRYWQIINLIAILSVLAMGGALVSICVMQRLEAVRMDAESDFLSGLKTRRAFEQLASSYCHARSGEYAASIIIIDLDHFKQVNDEYGHSAGDAVIRAIGELICRQTRTSDMAGRMGGEEFCLILPGTDLAGARTLGDRLRTRISELEMTDLAKDVRITASFGVAELGQNTLFEDIYPVADAALYEAKSCGRNKVVCAQPPKDGGAPVRRKIIEKRDPRADIAQLAS
jgi:diguanylate cyclase (GGDEF)-like protein